MLALTESVFNIMSKTTPPDRLVVKPDSDLVQLPLRKRGRLAESNFWPPDEKKDPPRALRSLSKIISEDLCHRCGSCVGICPTGVLGLDGEEYPVVKNLSACTDCDLCVKVCPGEEFDAPSFAHQQFGYVPDYHDMHGHYTKAFISYANDQELRNTSTSGGLITGLLIYLLESGQIDGALVVGSDEDQKWKGKPFIARSREELITTAKSKYAISPTNVEFEEIRRVPGRYAIVGLPCQIHGFHKAARLDRKLKERVVLTIGLFCHAAIEHDPMRFLWDRIESERKDITKFISRVGKHPGTPHIQFSDGTQKPFYFPNATGFRPTSMEILNILYRMYTPPRCMTCYDGTAEFADIAVGDPWLPAPADDVSFYDGYSFALVRTKNGEAQIAAAVAAGAITLRELDDDVARTCNRSMGEEKRWRAFRIIETHRRQGRAIPTYGFETPSASGKQLFLTELNMLTHTMCFISKGRLAVLRMLFSPVGYRVLWLNSLRRRFRKWYKSRKAAAKRAQKARTALSRG